MQERVSTAQALRSHRNRYEYSSRQTGVLEIAEHRKEILNCTGVLGRSMKNAGN